MNVTAGSVRIDGMEGQFTGIAAQAEPGSSGMAGQVTLIVDSVLEILRTAMISSSTGGKGDAGYVKVNAQHLRAQDGYIGSIASSEAIGHAGRVAVMADRLQLSEGSLISIASLNPDAPSPAANSGLPWLQVQAGHLELDASGIDAQSAGQVPAAPIEIQAGVTQLTNASRITTQSQQADAGPITLNGGWLWLQNSQITTSAEGQAGNGGAIQLTPKQLILDSGFIQANAASDNGGDISINPQALLYPATQQLLVGGTERLEPEPGLNVIQAVAPQGVSGHIELTAVDLDISSALVPLRVPFQDPNAMLSDVCQIGRIEEASALINQGRGGLPPNASAPASTTLNHARLKRLLDER